ncbi:Na(+) H(+) antiporter subunit E [Devosia sp. LC5]|uniref:Na+/H+ antiporter subunit E n=1 Tax=Devosia sp. LC5 TaxID=1502724 RepID=UPI0004E423F0|nr:Na+/H+ antiporter subunit E [Devosia sp. LC5]KFC71385.1 Na(+) H(+) antiporter subunit E [Devosia sp. LC5]
MSPAAIVIVLALGWAAITGNFSGLNLLFGAAIGAIAVLLLRRAFAPPRALRKLRRISSLALLFVYELMLSAIRVAIIVVTPDLKSALRPAIVAVPLTVKSDAEITLLANLITLTPGTLSIDVSEDRGVLYVHALTLSTREALIADIAKGFEIKVKEVFE